jgi:hypothetical protein
MDTLTEKDSNPDYKMETLEGCSVQTGESPGDFILGNLNNDDMQ